MIEGPGNPEPAGRYLVEAYVSADGGAEQLAVRASQAAMELAREGRKIRHLSSIYVPRDETCFHLYEATSPADVGEASARAGMTAARVLEALELTGSVAVSASPDGTSNPTTGAKR